MLIKCNNMIEVLNEQGKVEIRLIISPQTQETVDQLLQQHAGNVEEHNKSVDMQQFYDQPNIDWTNSLIRG